MSTDRILVLARPGRARQSLLREAAAQASPGSVIRVVRILDTRSGFVGDGPAGQLPGERIARRAAGERLALEAAVHDAGIPACEIDVLWGEPATTFSALVANWRPDRVLGRERWAPRFGGKPEGRAWPAALWGRMTGRIRAADCPDAAL